MDNRRLRFLTHEEAKGHFRRLANKKVKPVYSMALLSLHTGLRFVGIANLQWETIDPDRGLIYVMDTRKGEQTAPPYMTGTSG